jgi:hypothetical protein
VTAQFVSMELGADAALPAELQYGLPDTAPDALQLNSLLLVHYLSHPQYELLIDRHKLSSGSCPRKQPAFPIDLLHSID